MSGVCVCVCIPRSLEMESLELEIQKAVKHLVWVLQTELGVGKSSKYSSAV